MVNLSISALLVLTATTLFSSSGALRAGIRVKVQGYGVIDQSQIKVTHREPGKLYQLYRLKDQANYYKTPLFTFFTKSLIFAFETRS